MRRLALTGAVAAAVMMLGTTLGTTLGTGAASAYPAPLPDDLAVPTLASHPIEAPAIAGHPKQVHALKRATRRFHDLQRAEDAGYGLFTDAAGVACIGMPAMNGMPAGGMGVHFVDTKLVGDPTEQVPHPEALVYRLDKNSRLRLAAVEYVVIASAWDAHHARPPRLFGHRFLLTAAGNRYGLPAYYSLHAWVWDHNPAGRFAPYNPRVSCPS